MLDESDSSSQILSTYAWWCGMSNWISCRLCEIFLAVDVKCATKIYIPTLKMLYHDISRICLIYTRTLYLAGPFNVHKILGITFSYIHLWYRSWVLLFPEWFLFFLWGFSTTPQSAVLCYHVVNLKSLFGKYSQQQCNDKCILNHAFVHWNRIVHSVFAMIWTR